MGFCVKAITTLVALAAIFLGCLYSGLIAKTGVFQYVDTLETPRGPVLKGMVPAFHEGTPWGFTEEQMPNLKDQVFIVTGANVGLGYWTTYHLAKAGGSVVMACRTQSKCAAAADKIAADIGPSSQGHLDTMTLDLSSFASIRSFASDFLATYTTLNSLVLNAGVMSPPFQTTKEGLELQIGTNHFGHHLLTKLLLPVLETTATEAGSATVVAVSSAAHYSSYEEGIKLSLEALNDEASYDRTKAYGQSKLANVLFAQELAERVSDKNIFVNSIHPGAVDTDLPRHFIKAIKGFVGEWAATTFVDNVMPKAGRGSWHPKDAALTQVYAAVSPEIKAQGITGKYFHPIARQTDTDPHAKDMKLQKGLWELTESFIAEN